MTYFVGQPVIALDDEVIVTLVVDSGITISEGNDVTMAPNIGIASDSSIGTSSWLVRTNDVSGYSLAVKADSTPAMVSVENKTFEDYTETFAGTPEAWSLSSGTKEFGYSAYGTDTPVGTWGAAASCGAGGVPNAGQLYVGFTQLDKTIATKDTVTPTEGITTTICFAAEQNGIFASSGTYTATITATAVTL